MLPNLLQHWCGFGPHVDIKSPPLESTAGPTLFFHLPPRFEPSRQFDEREAVLPAFVGSCFPMIPFCEFTQSLFWSIVGHSNSSPCGR